MGKLRPARPNKDMVVALSDLADSPQIVSGNATLDTLADWERHAGPKSADQWQGGRSAKEVARAWLAARPSMPDEVVDVLATIPAAFGPIEAWRAQPELKLKLDGFRGEPRNTDLFVEAKDRFGAYPIAVEAKADEAFGETVADALAAAIDRGLGHKRSNGVARIERLARVLLGPRRTDPRPVEARLGALRYQLLTATGGLLRRAGTDGARRAVLLIHEFRTFATEPKKHAANAADIDKFVTRISHGVHTRVEPGRLYGPIRIPAYPHCQMVPDLYVGKAVRHIPDPRPMLRVLAQHGSDEFLLGDSRESMTGFRIYGMAVATVSPVELLARDDWSEPSIDARRQAELVRRAKGTL